MEEKKKIIKLDWASSSVYPAYPLFDMPSNPGTTYVGISPFSMDGDPRNYLEEIRQCRHFYKYDPIASTVINRMCEMAITDIKNRRINCTDEEVLFFNAVAKKLNRLLEAICREYLVNGMAIPDVVVGKVMGSKLDPNLGRTRYYFPDKLWVRNPENIVLKKRPLDIQRDVFLKIPEEERFFIQNEGKYKDGTFDKEAYYNLVRQFPEYVELVKNGATLIPLPSVKPVARKTMSHEDYPQPFLVPALGSLKHKLQIKMMDYSIAKKALESIRQIKVGSDEFPVEEGDDIIVDLKNQIEVARRKNGGVENIYTLYTPHTVEIVWSYPPLDALLSDAKYSEPNADIFMALGFSRVLLVGESLRSNSGTSVATTIGPVSTLNEIRLSILEWVEKLYADLAEKNGFRAYPKPSFGPIPSADLVQLVQFAIEAAKQGIISKDTVAKMFNSDFESEHSQIDAEMSIDNIPTPVELNNPAAMNPQTNEISTATEEV